MYRYSGTAFLEILSKQQIIKIIIPSDIRTHVPVLGLPVVDTHIILHQLLRFSVCTI